MATDTMRAEASQAFSALREFILYNGSYQNKKALIVDTRFNTGGDLLNLLTSFLGGKIYLTKRRQGYITKGGEPATKWDKPSALTLYHNYCSEKRTSI